MADVTILWADDEIELLKPQIMYLENKGYNVIPVTNGQDSIQKCAEENVDVVFLDEHMPGLSGLEALPQIKSKAPEAPVVMITKNEEENIMDEAIGQQIADYLIKPVKNKQMLLTIKKLIDNKRLVSEKAGANYQQEFQKIFMRFQEKLTPQQWAEVYNDLVYWELELDNSGNEEMQEILETQKQEANTEFCKFVSNNYVNWLDHEDDEETPVMSHTMLENKVLPHLSESKPTFFVLIDNLRLDQFKTILPIITQYYNIQEQSHWYSILPTATQYSRNSIFSGLLPSEIEDEFPNYWLNDDDEGGKNLHEEHFLDALLDRTFHDEVKYEYHKITNFDSGKKLEENILNSLDNHLVVIVYNFVDLLSHARTDTEVLKELAYDESGYRSITHSWLQHSPLHTMLEKLAEHNINLVITTDHGSIRVKTPSKCIGDRNTTTNIRYKTGKNLSYVEKDVFAVEDPYQAFLPKPNVSSSFIFAKDDRYLVYPNNYNYFVKHFNDTFQHGGLSLEEMIVPFGWFTPKK